MNMDNKQDSTQSMKFTCPIYMTLIIITLFTVTKTQAIVIRHDVDDKHYQTLAKQYKKAIDLINNYPNINKEYNYHHFQSFQKAICFYNLKEVDSTLFFSNLFLKEKNEKCKRSNLITIYDIISNQ